MSNQHPVVSAASIASFASADGRDFIAYMTGESVFLEHVREDGRRTKGSVIEFEMSVVAGIARLIGLKAPAEPTPIATFTSPIPISGVA